MPAITPEAPTVCGLAPFIPRPPMRYKKRQPAPVPPPTTLLHVASVTWAGPAPNISHWTFDRDIVTPPALPLTLTINGYAPVGVSLLGPRLLEVAYPLGVIAGAWHCPADAANIVSVDGYKLAAGSGTVG